MLLTIISVNVIVSVILYYISLNGINHFIDSSTESQEEKNKDEFRLKFIATILLLVLLCGNGIIYYNSYENTGNVDVVEDE